MILNPEWPVCVFTDDLCLCSPETEIPPSMDLGWIYNAFAFVSALILPSPGFHVLQDLNVPLMCSFVDAQILT